MNLTTTFTDYNFKFGSQQDQFKFELLSGVKDFGAKMDFSYFPGSSHKLKWGANYIYHIFTPTSVSAQADTVVFDTGVAQNYIHESALYFLDEFDINDNFRINAGLDTAHISMLALSLDILMEMVYLQMTLLFNTIKEI